MPTIPLSLYIHTPWCIRKCPYCDFNSHTLRGEIPEQTYIEALSQELTIQAPLLENRPISSIFIGGGTPSLLSAQAYAKLFTLLKKQLHWNSDIEITLEANPGSVEQKRFAAYREIGINRLSLGIQSLQNDKLKILGRIHNNAEALQAVKIAQQAGFGNFNLDLMFGLPQQSIEDALNDLQSAIILNPTHLSWYQLTLEPQTYFFKHPPLLPTDDFIWEMQQQGEQLLKSAGFQHYEVSAYSQAGFNCQHNLNYWTFGDYLGIGAGAHSKITNLKTTHITRYWNIKAPKEYMNPHTTYLAGTKTLEPTEIPLEFMINALRLKNPIPLTLFTARTGLEIHCIEKQLNEAKNQGFIILENNQIHLTNFGQRFLNEVLEIFLV